MVDEELYRQEVEELTDLMKNEWDDLRKVLIDANFNLSGTLLASFMEDDEENEFGVLVTEGKKVFEYARSTEEAKNNIQNFKVKEITNDKETCEQYPQIAVALKMVDEGYFNH